MRLPVFCPEDKNRYGNKKIKIYVGDARKQSSSLWVYE